MEGSLYRMSKPQSKPFQKRKWLLFQVAVFLPSCTCRAGQKHMTFRSNLGAYALESSMLFLVSWEVGLSPSGLQASYTFVHNLKQIQHLRAMNSIILKAQFASYRCSVNCPVHV